MEVVFVDEEGSGLGPTLEFYEMLSNELRMDTKIWRSGVPNEGLYPRGIQYSNDNEVKEIAEKF